MSESRMNDDGYRWVDDNHYGISSRDPQKRHDLAFAFACGKSARDAEIAALRAQLVEAMNGATRLVDQERRRWYAAFAVTTINLEGYAPELAARIILKAEAANLSGLLKAAQAVDAAVAASHEPSDWFVALTNLHRVLASCAPGGADPKE